MAVVLELFPAEPRRGARGDLVLGAIACMCLVSLTNDRFVAADVASPYCRK